MTCLKSDKNLQITNSFRITQSSYNLSYTLLGLIAENKEGKSWEEIVKKFLNFKNCRNFSTPEPLSHTATGRGRSFFPCSGSSKKGQLRLHNTAQCCGSGASSVGSWTFESGSDARLNNYLISLKSFIKLKQESRTRQEKIRLNNIVKNWFNK